MGLTGSVLGFQRKLDRSVILIDQYETLPPELPAFSFISKG